MKDKQLTEVKDQLPAITAEDVKKFFCANASEKEIAMFLNIAKLNGLNPFKREIYLVKYGSSPASILTGYEVYLKRAERTGNYNGFKVWTEGKIPDMKACIEVSRKDWTKPLYHEVEYSEYVGKTKEGNLTRFWKDKPKTMLKKVVISQAFRFAFPDELTGMPYTQDEVNVVDIEPLNQPKEVIIPKPQENNTVNNMPALTQTLTDSILGGENQKEAERPAEPEKTHAEANSEVPDDFKITINRAQQIRLFAIARDNNWSKEELKYYLNTIGYESTKDIPKSKYDGICDFLNKDKR